MAKLPNNLSVDEREHAASEVINLVIEATARELAACIEAIQKRREKANVEGEPSTFCEGLGEAARTLRLRAKHLGIPHRVDNQITKPLDIQRKAPVSSGDSGSESGSGVGDGGGDEEA